MGGSSKSQTVGYKYFASMAVAIGNRIEDLIGINFDKRGWQFGKTRTDLGAQGLNLLIDKPNLYGENEGGVSGNIRAHLGQNDQLPDEHYQQYFPKVSAYPYQSYLVFRGFYVGNSGFLKEMLLWPKRIHVKNDGSAQWYDEKAEMPAVLIRNINNELSLFELPVKVDCLWTISNTNHSATYAYGRLPFYEKDIGYSLRYSEDGVTGAVNGPPLEEQPSFYSSRSFLTANGLSSVKDNQGISLPSTSWSRIGPPEFDDDTVFRTYMAKGDFYWSGGIFKYLAVLSSNGASFKLFKLVGSNPIVFINISASSSSEYLKYQGEIYLDPGLYYVECGSGSRYGIYGETRPFCYILANISAVNLSAPDINPIHKIREILTDDTAMNKPQSDINEANFIAAADRIYSEGLGISWAITEKSCKEALDEICEHIEAGVRVNRQTGQYEVILFRDDWYDLNTAQSFNESNIKTMQLNVANSDEIINTLNVTYYDRDNIKKSAFNVAEIGLIHTVGHEQAETIDFPYFMNRRNAEIVANWKLKQLSTPAWSGAFTTGSYEARKLNRYDVIKLSWASKGLDNLPVRITKISLGDGRDNTVTIDFVEVVPYSESLNTTINVDPPAASTELVPQPSQSVAFEMPYLEMVQQFGQYDVDQRLAYNPDISYLMVAAKRPQDNSLNALLYTDPGTGYEKVSNVDYCATADLDQAIGYLDSSFSVKNTTTIESVIAGSLALIDSELVVFQSYDATTKIMTVKRGALDTVPQPHLQNAVFYFYDNYASFDQAQYALSEIIKAKVLTTTPSGVLDIASASELSLTMQSRAIRPYPPANVKINNVYYPVEVSGNSMILTWVDRNRVQQTGGDALGYFDAGVTIESGVTYQLKVYEITSASVETVMLDINIGAVNAYTVDLSATLATTIKYRIELHSVRGLYYSYQFFSHTIVKPFSAPYNLTAEFIP